MRSPSLSLKLGFTLLELLVVLVILGLLTAYVGPRYFGQLAKAEFKSAQTQIQSFTKALDAYRLDVGGYPSTGQGLAALHVKPNDTKNWFGPYLDKPPPNDPWGRPYVYSSPGTQGEFDLHSLGKDGAAGGEGENADITP